MRRLSVSLVVSLLCVAARAAAQETPEHGAPEQTAPTTVEGQPASGQGTPPGHPPVGPGTGAPHGAGGAGRGQFDAPPIASAEPSGNVPAGSIRVTVIDVAGRPVSDASVLLGTMAQGGDRERVSALTDARGVATFADLSTGTSQAYRVNVPFEGATYSSTPFQLPTDRGYEVRILRLPTTHDERTVLQLIGQTFVEVREERLHVIQQTQLANMSSSAETYVFPTDGVRIPLPEGFLAFQTQPVMTDQRVEQVAGEGLRIRGSLPPGRVTLIWAFDLPITGSDMDVTFPVPFRTYTYRVITDAPPGMSLDLEGLPDPHPFDDEGRPLFGSELVRRPGDAPFESFTLRFRDIPGPGPLRWIAVAVALALVLGGLLLAVRGGSATEIAARGRAARKQELLDEAAALDRDLAAGEVGPQYRQKRRDAIVRELAVLLHLERQREQESSKTSRDPRPARVPARTESG
jgi:hypothetical protein